MNNSKELVSSLFPENVTVDKNNLMIGDLKISNIVEEFGSPLYLYDFDTIKQQYDDFRQTFSNHYGELDILYASKVFLNLPIAKMLNAMNVKFDVVSHGEISLLLSANISLSNAYFHGNNKTIEEIDLAVANNIGAIIIDNLEEIEIVDEISSKYKPQKVLLRVTPNIDPYTHEKTTTGLKDSKFGLNMDDGSAENAIELIASKKNIFFAGIHAHLGSPINFIEPYQDAIDKMFKFIKEICIDKHRLEFYEFSPGGGFGIVSEPGMVNPSINDFALAISESIKSNCEKYSIDLPKLFIEPGRSLMARSGLSIYKVGSRKIIKDVRTYLSVDGGMSDNIRPTLYDAKYFALPLNGLDREFNDLVTIAGKYCESGDYLIKDILLPKLVRDEYIVVPMSGAYQLAMASNYNLAYKPAVIAFTDNQIKLIRKRESIDDIIALDAI
tara:strand:+ start:1061 stop:2383 length:1323 start_codon:yes stop_codon:yes gene_type:complete